MAEPNYMAYAQYMGARNPIADGINQIGGTLSDIGKMNMQRENQARQNSLADLQIQNQQLTLQEAQQQAADKQGLRNTLSNLQPTTTTKEVPNPLAGQTVGPRVQPQFDPMTPSAMRPPELSMAPSTTQPQTMQQTTTTPADPMKAIFDHAMKTGALDVAKNAIDMQTLIRNSTPDKLKQAEQIKELGTFTAALKHVKEIKQAGILNQNMLDGILAMMPESIQAKFPNGLKQSDISADGGLEVKDAQGNVIARWAISPDGTKTELIKATDKDKETWSEPYMSEVGGKKVMLQKSSTGQIKPVVTDTSTTVKVNTGGNKTDPIIVREAIKDLPKQRREAQAAEGSKARISQMLPMIESGSAGGLSGNVLSKLSTIFDTPATSEADLFKKMATAGAGAMRLSVVGPGPVSNYENQLMQSISGGGNGARSSIIKLLKFYQTEADRTINNYNDAVESADTVAPNASKAFRKIGSGSQKQSTIPKGKDPLGIL